MNAIRLQNTRKFFRHGALVAAALWGGLALFVSPPGHATDLRDFSVLGTQPEFPNTVGTPLTFGRSSEVRSLNSGGSLVFGPSPAADSAGGTYYHFWSVNGGTIEKTSPATGFREIRFLAPTVSAPQNFHLYHWYGNARGHREIFYTITVSPGGGVTTGTVAVSAGSSQNFTITRDIPNFTATAVSDSNWASPGQESLFYGGGGVVTRRSVGIVIEPNPFPFPRTSRIHFFGSGTPYELIITQAAGQPTGVPFLFEDGLVVDDDQNTSYGNGDGQLNPGEHVELEVFLKNGGTSTATGVRATISSTDPYVRILDERCNWSDLNPGARTTQIGDFDFEILHTCPNNYFATLNLRILSDQGSWDEVLFWPVTRSDVVEPRMIVYSPNGQGLSEIHTPSTFFGTRFGPVELGQSASTTYEVSSAWFASLLDVNVSIVGTGADQFFIKSKPAREIRSGERSPFEIAFAPNRLGLSEAEVVVTSSSPSDPVLRFTIDGTATHPGTPLIRVTGNSLPISNRDTEPSAGDGTDLGSTTPTETVSRYFQVHNDGDGPLLINQVSQSGSSYFRVSDVTQQIDGGDRGGFWVHFEPNGTTRHSSTTISIQSNASTAPYFSYQFEVRADSTMAVDPPRLSVSSNTSVPGSNWEWNGAYSLTVWEGSANQNVQFAVGNSGSGTFSYLIAVDQPGWMQIWPNSQRTVTGGDGFRIEVVEIDTANMLPGFYTGNITVTGNQESFVMPVSVTVHDVVGLSVASEPGLPLSRGGDGDWFGQRVDSNSGYGAARSPKLWGGSQSWVETSVTGPGTLSFWWKVDSGPGDFLEFNPGIPGNVRQISGNQNWQKVDYSIGEGFHTFRWTYSKNTWGSAGEDAGWLEEVQFVPAASNPTVITGSVGGVTQNSATAGGNVTNSGGAPVTERGVVFSTSPNPSINAGNKVVSGMGTGSFALSLNNLAAGSTYFIRAYAINSAGTGYGEQITFSTFQNNNIPVRVSNNQAVPNLSAAVASELHYVVSVPPGLRLLTISISAGSGDADLYVRREAAPTPNTFDHAPFLNGNEETVEIARPEPGDYFIMIRAYEEFSNVTLIVQSEAEVDPTAPVVSIRGPRKFTTAKHRVRISGSVYAADGGVAWVRFRDSRPRGAGWRSAQGRTRWTATVVLAGNRTNLVQFQAAASNGLLSRIQTVRIRSR